MPLDRQVDTPADEIEALLEQMEAYAKTNYELAKLKSLDKATEVSTSFISRMSVVVTVTLCLLILNIGIALLIGELLGKMYFGFFVVSGFYLLASIALHYFLHKWIKSPISNALIIQALQ